MLVAASIVFTVAAGMMGLARNFGDLLCGRCIVGFAVGLASSTVPLYLAELAPADMRGLLVSVNNSCIVIGQVSAAIIDGLLSADKQTGWRWMLGLGGVPSIVQFVGLLALPESPRWLISRGREDDARKVLTKLRAGSSDLETVVETEVDDIVSSLALSGATPSRAQSGGTSTTAVVPTIVQESDSSVNAAASPVEVAPAAPPVAATMTAAAPAAAATAGGVSIKDLWAVRRQLSLGVGLLMLQQLIGINTIMYYSVSILVQARVGTVQQSIWLAVPVAASQLVGCLIGGALIDRVGRRVLALFSLTGAALSLALEGGAFYLEYSVCRDDGNSTLPNATSWTRS